MRLWKKKKNNGPSSPEEMWKSRFEALQKDYEYLKNRHKEEVASALKKTEDELFEEMNKLQKEAVYWKEKALSFKRFHQ